MAVHQIPTCKIVDTSAKLTAANVESLLAADYAGVVRYVRLPNVNDTWDIDGAELDVIVNGGLGLLLVQHVRYPGWSPGTCSGAADASAALERATAAGYEAGAHIFLDLEGIRGTAQATIEFANDWADAIVGAGYGAGCYVGYAVPLTPVQLYDLHKVDSYWSDAGNRAVATRGFAIKQRPEIHIDNVPYDPDDVAPDGKGETPRWMTDAAAT